MSPKLKAEELIKKFRGFESLNEDISSVQCAETAVIEIISALKTTL